MALQTLQFKRGTSAEVAAYTPAVGEPVLDITTNSLVVGDGVTPGGVSPVEGYIESLPLATEVTDDDVFVGNQDGTTKRMAAASLREYVLSDVTAPTNTIFGTHRKKLIKQLPIVFPDYVAIQTLNGNSYLYPQGFFVDERTDEVLIAYNASGGTYSRHIVVYTLSTGVYKGAFQLTLSAGSGGGESFTVVWTGSVRTLVNKYGDSKLATYDITTWPSNRSLLPVASLKNVPVFFQVSSKGGEYLIEETGPTIGGSTTRTQFGVYDSDFNRIRDFSYTKMDSGFTGSADNAFAPYIPKAQGVCLGPGYVATVHGGIVVFADPSTLGKQFAYQGPRIYSTSGQILAESICDPLRMKAVFEANGLPTDRFEYEGVCVTDSNRILTLNLHQSRFGVQATLTGIVIMEEFSTDPDAIDFTQAVYSFPHQDVKRLESGMFPRGSNGELFNPVTGSQFTTMDQVLDYMDLMSIGRFAYYSSSVSISNVPGIPSIAASETVITNCNHITFRVAITTGSAVKHYQITGSSGSRSAVLLTNNSNGFRMANEVSGVVDRLHRVSVENRDSSLPDILVIDAQTNVANSDLRIGGGSTLFRSCTQLRFFTAPDLASNSVERWQINQTGALRPLTNNAVDLGTASARPANVYGVNGDFSGPVKVGQYTLSTLPGAAAFTNALILVTNATGGAKWCMSNGTIWQILNTTTTVS